jgi:hypothetical protein
MHRRRIAVNKNRTRFDYGDLQERYAANAQIGNEAREGAQAQWMRGMPGEIGRRGDGKQQREHEEDQAQHWQALRINTGGMLAHGLWGGQPPQGRRRLTAARRAVLYRPPHNLLADADGRAGERQRGVLPVGGWMAGVVSQREHRTRRDTAHHNAAEIGVARCQRDRAL